MDDQLISVIDVARRLGVRKQTVFKVLLRHGIDAVKQRNSSNRNQLISYITHDELVRINTGLLVIASKNQIEQIDDEAVSDILSTEQGAFYLLQLEPTHDAGRFKVGFAGSMSERLRALRCSAPYAMVVKTWPCRRLWEKTAIDCVTVDCERLHTEVFRTDSLKLVIDKCEQFFRLMPAVTNAQAEPESGIDRAGI